MPSIEESIIIGHKEEPLCPERQMDFLRKHLRGEKTPYNNPTVIIWAARKAIMNAVNIVHTTGEQKGEKKYTNLELEGMNAEVDRLEKLSKRKNGGENIKQEIDGPIPEEKTDKQKHEPIIFRKPEISSDVPEIVKIKALIDDAVDYNTKGNITKANKTFAEAIEMIEKAKLKGIDVKDVEREKKSLGTFFKD